MNKRKIRPAALDLFLLTAIVALLAYLLTHFYEPALEAWRNLPRPGVQVCQQYIAREGNDAIATARQVNYLLYLPPTYAASQKWPLVVYLHGSGHRGRDVNVLRQAGPPKQIERGKQFSFILVSPQCPPKSRWNAEAVIELIEHIGSSLSVDQDRVYLTGYSMGGFGTWAAACRAPACFAAIAPLCGGGDVSQAERLAKVPIWAFHGAKDQVVPFKASEAMVDAVRKSGGHVEFTVYPDAGHGICEETYQNQRLYDWLLTRRRGHPR